MPAPISVEEKARIEDDAAELLRMHDEKRVYFDNLHAHMRGRKSSIYVPASASAEYRSLAEMAAINVFPLVVRATAQNLFADGYRAEREEDNSPAWKVWQKNRMDARQSYIYRPTLTYGLAYGTVLPAPDFPRITLYTPRQMLALYEDWDDEWAVAGIGVRQGYAGVRPIRRVDYFDDRRVYHLAGGSDGQPVELISAEEHSLGVTPIIRWRNPSGDHEHGAEGEIEQLIPLQGQLQQVTFELLKVQNSGSFRQKWVTGEKTQTDENGVPVRPYNPSVDTMFTNESPDARFGNFDATELGQYIDSRKSVLALICATAQISPHALLVSESMSNISAEAFAALEAGGQRKASDCKTSFGESDEQMLRLAALAGGDRRGWEDTSAQMVWRDTRQQSFAEVMDGLGKAVEMLHVPYQEIWEKIPGATRQDIQRWRAADVSRKDAEALAALAGLDMAGTGTNAQ